MPYAMEERVMPRNDGVELDKRKRINYVGVPLSGYPHIAY